MTIAGISIILLLGIGNFGLLVFQLVTGLHYIKVSLGVHKKVGIALLVMASLHGTLAILAG
jgi:hypothetical protein